LGRLLVVLLPLLELFLRHVLGIEIRAGRLGRHAGDERLAVIEAGPRTLVDAEVVILLAPGIARISGEPGFERRIAGPDLAAEKRIQQLGGFNDLGESLPVLRGQRSGIGADLRRGEAGDLCRERGWFRGWRRWRGASHQKGEREDQRQCAHRNLVDSLACF
jgi:hypothetical protein